MRANSGPDIVVLDVMLPDFDDLEVLRVLQGAARPRDRRAESASAGTCCGHAGQMFTAKLRCSGASLGYQLGALLGGAVAPLLSVYLLDVTGGTAAISIYIIIVSLIAVASTIARTETYQNDLDDVRA